jgi:IS66 C-terminal element
LGGEPADAVALTCEARRGAPQNALFAGSDGGAEHWAVIASLIETCKLNDVEPNAYLATTITKIVNGHRNSRLDELLPWAYPAASPLKMWPENSAYE